MTIHRMLAAAGVLLLVAAAGCGSSTETATDEPAAAAPTLPPPSTAGTAGDGEAPVSRLAPVFKGEARLGYLQPTARMQGTLRVTSMTIKNLNDAAIAGLRVDEIGVDKAGLPVTRAETFRYPRLDPGEVLEVRLEVPTRPNMANTRYEFAHGNGTIKPVLLKSIDEEP